MYGDVGKDCTDTAEKMLGYRWLSLGIRLAIVKLGIRLEMVRYELRDRWTRWTRTPVVSEAAHFQNSL